MYVIGFHNDLTPLLLDNMLYLGVEIERTSLNAQGYRHISDQFIDQSNHGDGVGGITVYLSLASLSQNDACRAAMNDSIFFSKEHELLRKRIAGTNFFLSAFANNPLLVPNGLNGIDKAEADEVAMIAINNKFFSR